MSGRLELPRIKGLGEENDEGRLSRAENSVNQDLRDLLSTFRSLQSDAGETARTVRMTTTDMVRRTMALPPTQYIEVKNPRQNAVAVRPNSLNTVAAYERRKQFVKEHTTPFLRDHFT
eukprot:gene30045-37511_t